jgi:hypothetical protein
MPWSSGRPRSVSENDAWVANEAGCWGQCVVAGFLGIFITAQVDMKFSEIEAVGRSPEGFLSSVSLSSQNISHVLRRTLR